MEREPDFEGIFHLDAGYPGPAGSGVFRPHHAIHENYLTSGIHTYLDRELVHPGESAPVAVHFITPHFYPHCIWEGRDLLVQAGARLVGHLVVTRIINETLRVSPEAYNPRWVEPPELRQGAS